MLGGPGWLDTSDIGKNYKRPTTQVVESKPEVKSENTNTNSTTTQEKPKSRSTGGGRFVSYRYPNKMLTGSTDYLKIKVVEYLSLIHI